MLIVVPSFFFINILWYGGAPRCTEFSWRSSGRLDVRPPSACRERAATRRRAYTHGARCRVYVGFWVSIDVDHAGSPSKFPGPFFSKKKNPPPPPMGVEETSGCNDCCVKTSRRRSEGCRRGGKRTLHLATPIPPPVMMALKGVWGAGRGRFTVAHPSTSSSPFHDGVRAYRQFGGIRSGPVRDADPSQS